MNRAIPALLALVLVLSLPATTVGSAMLATDTEHVRDGSATLPALQQETAETQSTPVEIENTTNRLPLAGDVREDHVEYKPDLGAALASADDGLRIDHEQYVLADSEFEDATPDERVEMIETAYSRIQDQVDTLEQSEREAVRAHANGERSTAEVLGTIARNYQKAEILDGAIADLEAKSYRTNDYSLSNSNLGADRAVLDFRRTAIRTDLATALQYPATEPSSVRLETSQNGYRLSMVDGGNYLSETVRFDNRDLTQPDQFEEYESIDRADELYPWASESISDPFPNMQAHSAERGFYSIEYFHNHGTLEIHLDAGTGNVYHEIQKLSIGSLPVTNERMYAGNGLELSLNETPANGPVEVTVTDSLDEPESATISIDGVEIGTTDADDGTRWIIPPSDEYELQTETSSGILNATVSPSDADE
ncbi:DUF7096 domain-containing protein [Halopiger aswanensis]|uniref:Uncharacterized protein n=1 Tax=Halopiger aswanensis TaxID=148449 RepID=A0A419WCV7_9EURY|nr:hypothetical protein [Halopiger aswanensis]RKD93307.1 hypothetical protein ATJ93_2925 [Halopiger aswanensis]